MSVWRSVQSNSVFYSRRFFLTCWHWWPNNLQRHAKFSLIITLDLDVTFWLDAQSRSSGQWSGFRSRIISPTPFPYPFFPFYYLFCLFFFNTLFLWPLLKVGCPGKPCIFLVFLSCFCLCIVLSSNLMAEYIFPLSFLLYFDYATSLCHHLCLCLEAPLSVSLSIPFLSLNNMISGATLPV